MIRRLPHDDKILQRNLSALRARGWQHLADIAEAPPQDKRLIVIEEEKGRPNILLQDDDQPLLYYHPTVRSSIQSLLDGHDWENVRLCVSMGIGLGHEIQALTSIHPDYNGLQQLVILEKSKDIFRLAMRAGNFTSAIEHDKIFMLVGDDTDEIHSRLFKECLSGGRIRMCRSIEIVASDGALAFGGEDYVTYSAVVRAAVKSAITDLGNDPKDVLIGLHNMCRNIPHIVRSPGLHELRGLLEGKPAVVCAAGPSLTEALPLLKTVQNSIMLVAADTALKPMLAAGVRPHIVVSRERTQRTIKILEGVDDKGIFLCAIPVVPPECLENWKGGIVASPRSSGHFAWLPINRGILRFAGSSGNMAFKICELMAADPIILVGQDLAFADNGTTHVDGAAFGTRRDFFMDQQRVRVQGNLSESVLTCRSWINFLNRYNMDMLIHEGAVINCSPNGVRIKNTVPMPLIDAITRYGYEYKPADILLQIAPPPIDQQLREANTLSVHCERTDAAVHGIIKACREGQELVKRYRNLKPPAEIIEILSDNKAKKMERVVGFPPIEEINDKRTEIVGAVDRETFQNWMMVIVQSQLCMAEMEMYGLERSANGEEFYFKMLRIYDRWFTVVQELGEISLSYLEIAATAATFIKNDPANCQNRDYAVAKTSEVPAPASNLTPFGSASE